MTDHTLKLYAGDSLEITVGEGQAPDEPTDEPTDEPAAADESAEPEPAEG